MSIEDFKNEVKNEFDFISLVKVNSVANAHVVSEKSRKIIRSYQNVRTILSNKDILNLQKHIENLNHIEILIKDYDSSLENFDDPQNHHQFTTLINHIYNCLEAILFIL